MKHATRAHGSARARGEFHRKLDPGPRKCDSKIGVNLLCPELGSLSARAGPRTQKMRFKNRRSFSAPGARHSSAQTGPRTQKMRLKNLRSPRRLPWALWATPLPSVRLMTGVCSPRTSTSMSDCMRRHLRALRIAREQHPLYHSVFQMLPCQPCPGSRFEQNWLQRWPLGSVGCIYCSLRMPRPAWNLL